MVTCFLTFTIIGPIFAQLETWVLAGAEILVKNPLGAAAMGALYPWTVVMGLHHMYNVIEAGMIGGASGALGQGVGIEPAGDIVYAPYDGEISSVAESKHAIGITGENEQELLIHVGVDTVEMNGDGFEPCVKAGDKVKMGQPILKFSKDKIKAAGHPDTVVVLLTNSDDFEDVKYGDDLDR